MTIPEKTYRNPQEDQHEEDGNTKGGTHAPARISSEKGCIFCADCFFPSAKGPHLAAFFYFYFIENFVFLVFLRQFAQIETAFT